MVKGYIKTSRAAYILRRATLLWGQRALPDAGGEPSAGKYLTCYDNEQDFWFQPVSGNPETAGNVPTTAGNKSVTAGNKSVTAGNKSVTAGNNLATAGNKSVTAGNKLATAGNKSVTAGNTLVTAGNYSHI